MPQIKDTGGPSGYDPTPASTAFIAFQEAAGGAGSTKRTTIADLGGGGGGSAGSPIVRKFPFAYNTPNILTGAALYTPTIGDILLDAWIEIDTVWDGTTPLGDVGDFMAGNLGYFASTVNGFIDPPAIQMGPSNRRDNTTVSNSGLLIGSQVSSLATCLAVDAVWSLLLVPPIAATPTDLLNFVSWGPGGGGLYNGTRNVPGKFITADPVKVCVSQDGTNTGASPGSTTGAAVLYLVVASPI